MIIWILAIVFAVAAAALMTRPLWSGRAGAATRAAHDVALYKAQLRELERDAARGALSSAEVEAARREIGRRLLGAAAEAEREGDIAPAPRSAARGVALGAVAVSVAGALAIYASIGQPTLPDRPLAGRDFAAERDSKQPTQATAEAAFAETRGTPPPIDEETLKIIARMERLIEQRPKDVQGRVLLAQAYMRLGRAEEAWPLLAEVAEQSGGDVDPAIHAGQGEAMVTAAGGVVSREAQAVFKKAPGLPRSRYYLGLAAAQKGEYRPAIEAWAALYRENPDAPFADTLLTQIGQAAQAMGLDAEKVMAAVRGEEGPGAAPRGPSAADMEAAAEMSEEERQEMIQGMVGGLAERLEENPEDLSGWARLIRSYAVLKAPEKAAEAYEKAKAAFEGDEQALAQLANAARGAGLEP